MALGARRIEIIAIMLAMGGKLVAIGLVIGLSGALFVTTLLQSQLFGVTPNDPLSFAVVALVLSLVALAACYIPARRAGSVDPLVALRHE